MGRRIVFYFVLLVANSQTLRTIALKQSKGPLCHLWKIPKVNFLTGIFPSAIPSDSMSNLSKIRFHSSIGIDDDALDVKVYVLLVTILRNSLIS